MNRPFKALVLSGLFFVGFYLLAVSPVQAAPQQNVGGDIIMFDHFGFSWLNHGSNLAGGRVIKKRPPRMSAQAEAVMTRNIQAALASVTTVQMTGPVANRIDLTFIGDGFTSSQLTSYAQMVTSYAELMFNEIPFNQYRNYFNIHRIDLASAQSGVDNDPTKGIIKDSALNAQFWCAGIQRLICVDVAKVNAAAIAAPAADQKIVVVNSNTWGGGAYTGLGITTVTSGYPTLSPLIILHELGHSLGKLADEYSYDGPTVYSSAEPTAPNVSIYPSAQMLSRGAKWAHWLRVTDLSGNGVIGTFEGANYSPYGIYRPTYNSAMRGIGFDFNKPSLESIISEIYKIVSTIDAYSSTDIVWRGSDTIGIQVMEPTDHSLDIQWLVNGNLIAAANGKKTFKADDYNISSGIHTVKAQVTDNTDYVQKATFKQSLTQSKQWQVKVGLTDGRPQIVTQPVDTSIIENQTKNLIISAAGPGTLSYQWFKDGKAITGAVNPWYTVYGHSGVNGSSYYCRVTGSGGTIDSIPVKVKIDAPPAPIITSQPVSQTVPENTTVRFSVTASAIGNVSYAWYRNGSPISGATSSTLILTATLALSNYSYTCKVSNKGGSVTSSAAKLVVMPLSYFVPKITSQPVNQSISQDYPAYFSCAYSGQGPLSVQWYRNNVAISGFTKSSMAVPSVSVHDKAAFHCVARNQWGTAVSNKAYLTMIPSNGNQPKITVNPVNQTVPESNPANFSCSYTGPGTLSVQWYRNDVAISGFTNSSMRIPSVPVHDKAAFHCVVSNQWGRVPSAKAYLYMTQ